MAVKFKRFRIGQRFAILDRRGNSGTSSSHQSFPEAIRRARLQQRTHGLNGLNGEWANYRVKSRVSTMVEVDALCACRCDLPFYDSVRPPRIRPYQCSAEIQAGNELVFSVGDAGAIHRQCFTGLISTNCKIDGGERCFRSARNHDGSRVPRSFLLISFADRQQPGHE